MCDEVMIRVVWEHQDAGQGARRQRSRVGLLKSGERKRMVVMVPPIQHAESHLYQPKTKNPGRFGTQGIIFRTELTSSPARLVSFATLNT